MSPIRMSEAEARRAGLTVKGTKRKRRKPIVPAELPYPMFERMCAEVGLPIPYREVLFCEGRKWRFDFSWNDPKALKQGPKVALEVEGGVWTGGRHTTGTGFVGDVEKYNEAAIAGFMVLRCTPADMESGAVFRLLERVLR